MLEIGSLYKTVNTITGDYDGLVVQLIGPAPDPLFKNYGWLETLVVQPNDRKIYLLNDILYLGENELEPFIQKTKEDCM